MTTLLDAALDIATWPPRQRTPYASTTHVPWHMVEALREALEAQGIDWRNAQRIRRNDERRAARDWLLPHERNRTPK